MSRDPFAGYDAWLERPIQEHYARGDAEEAAWEHRGIMPEDIDPPHEIGGACPKCGEPKALEANDEDYEPCRCVYPDKCFCQPPEVLRCTNCDRDIDRDEKPTFDIGDYIAGLEEEAAERKAEARYDL